MPKQSWEKIKSKLVLVHPAVRIKELQQLLRKTKNKKSSREIKKLITKASFELDEGKLWGRESELNLHEGENILDALEPEHEHIENLEETVEHEAPIVQPKEEKLPAIKYTEPGEEYTHYESRKYESDYGEEYRGYGKSASKTYSREPIDAKPAETERILSTDRILFAEKEIDRIRGTYHRRNKTRKQDSRY